MPDAPPNNLPQPLTSFIGRERESAEVRELLTKTRLLTLVGSGGVGKSRLSTEVAADLLGAYSDGVWLVELSSLFDPALVPQAVASVLGVREEPNRSLTRTLADHLKPKHLLLLLDNCEHLLSACADLAHALLRACPNLRILASSREALGLPGEQTYRVPPLSLPDAAETLTPQSLIRYEAARLFVDRATLSQPTFAVTRANVQAVAQVCQHLDGIPLAIELAVARIKALSVEQIAARLDDRFRLLTGGSRMALPHHQTLRALIDWSYDLLSEKEQTLLCRLSVFAGGWVLEAAEAVCADFRGPQDDTALENPESKIESREVLDLLSSLVDKSLVFYEEKDGQARYRLLETLRQYGREKLTAAGQMGTLQERHLAYFLQIAEEAERKLRGSEQAWWLERLEAEHDNLRAALECSREARGERREVASDAVGSRLSPLDSGEAGLRLAAAIWWFWHVRGHFTEGRAWLDAMLAKVSERTTVRAKALHGAAVLARNQSDYAAARALAQESLEIKREVGDRQGIAASLSNLGTLSLAQGDYAAARPFYEESLAIERELGNRQGITASLIGMANVALEQGEFETARALYAESLGIKRELGDRRGIATSLVGLGNVAFFEGDHETARALYAESLALRRHLRDRRDIAHSLHYVANLSIRLGDFPTAVTCLTESMAIRKELGDKRGVAQSLKSFALLAVAQAASKVGNPASKMERAARLFGAAEGLREAIGAPLPPIERAEHDRHVAAARESLGAALFAEAWAQGRTMALDEAIEHATAPEAETVPTVERIDMEIDEARLERQVEEITGSDFFQQLQRKARRLRERRPEAP